MSLSDRQRRGAFKVCWSDTESVVAMSLGVVLQTVPAVPSQSVVPPTSEPTVPRVPPSEPSPATPSSRVPHDSTPEPAAPETTARHTRDESHPYTLRRPSVHAPAPARASVPPSGGCPAVRCHTSQPPVSARPSVPRRHTLVSRALSPPASPTLLSIRHTLFRPAVCPTLQETDCQRECSRVPLVTTRVSQLRSDNCSQRWPRKFTEGLSI